MLKCTGIPTYEDIKQVSPSNQRLNEGPVAIIECFQEIPCNPCSTHCPKGAISGMEDITKKPVIDFQLCNGCALCSSACPGLAIFVIDLNYSDDKAMIKLPYEFLPKVNENDIVKALDREGNFVENSRVIKVQTFKNNQKTPIVWLEVDKKNAMFIRNLRKEF